MPVALNISVEDSGERAILDVADALVGNAIREVFAGIGSFMAQVSSERVKNRPGYDSPTSDEHLGSFGQGIKWEADATGVDIFSRLDHALVQQEGGRILPKGKALAQPVGKQVKERGEWPRDIDPARNILEFRPPSPSDDPAIVGYLIDSEETPVAGGGLLYILRKWTDIEGQPYLFFDERDADRVLVLVTDYLKDNGLQDA